MITPAVWKSPYLVNTSTAGDQYDGQVIGALDGSFYSVWMDTNTARIVGRHYDASGAPLGGEIPITSAGGGGSNPQIAILPNQDILAVFTYPQGGGGSVSGDTYLGTYDANLNFIGFSSIETTATVSANPDVTGFADNGAFVTYTSLNSSTDWGIVGRSVSSTGVMGSPITLFDIGDTANNSHLATLDNQNLVVVYNSFNDIHFQIRSETGTVIKIDTFVEGADSIAVDKNPDVVALHNGGFAVVWTTTTGPSATEDIHATLYDRDGNVVRNDFIVNTTTAGNQDSAHLTSMDDGGFLVTWQDENTNDQKAQRFDGSGNHIGQEIVTHANYVVQTDVATLADGRTVASFDGYNGSNTDISDEILDSRTNITGHVTGHDLFGDGSADQLILRTASASSAVSWTGGLLTMYDLSSTSVLTQIGQVGADWSVAGSGDFNADGRSDILMQNDASGIRNIYSFTMGATQVTAITKLGAVGLDWQVDGTGDFNGDGFKDILLERFNNGAKELDVLGVNNGAVTSVNVAGILTPLTYQVDGIGDLNKDGKDDILLHHDDATGRHFVALNEANYTTQSITNVATIGTEWQAAGLGDFNGDGYADILIQHDTATARDLGILVNQGGSGWVFKDLGPIVGKNVQIDGIGDFNHDGTADISAHYDQSGSARTDIYLEMHNSAVTAIHTTGVVGHEWLIT
jgi:FG-GAP-like repeat